MKEGEVIFTEWFYLKKGRHLSAGPKFKLCIVERGKPLSSQEYRLVSNRTHNAFDEAVVTTTDWCGVIIAAAPVFPKFRIWFTSNAL